MVEGSGLENRPLDSPETPQIPEICASDDAHNAMFADGSASRDGTPVGTIYFVRASNTTRVKIGWASDLKRRLSELQTASPFKLKLLASFAGTMGDEQQLHLRFREDRLHREWFNLSNEMRQYLSERGVSGLRPRGMNNAPDVSMDELRKIMSDAEHQRMEVPLPTSPET